MAASKKQDSTVREKDLVLVHIEEQPAFYARVEGFTPDHKPNWWHIKLLVLTVPLRVVTWILRLEQLNGEPFTMGGTPIRIEKVEVPEEQSQLGPTPESGETAAEGGRDSDELAEGQRKARILKLGDKKPGNA